MQAAIEQLIRVTRQDWSLGMSANKGIWKVLKAKFLAGETVIASQVQQEMGVGLSSVNDALRNMAYMLQWRRQGINPTRLWALRNDKRHEMEEYRSVAGKATPKPPSAFVNVTPIGEDVERVFDKVREAQAISLDEIRTALGMSENRLRQVMKILRATEDKWVPDIGRHPRRVYIKEWRVINFDLAKQVALYAPGNRNDAPRIAKDSEQAELIKEASYKARKNKWVKEFKPCRDQAASWF